MDVSLGNLDCRASIFELALRNLTEVLDIDCKSAAQDFFHGAPIFGFIPTKQLLQTFCSLRLPLPQVIKVRLLAYQHLETGHWKGQVYKGIVVDSYAHEVAYEFEVDIGLHGQAIKVVELDVFVVLEHTVVRTQ